MQVFWAFFRVFSTFFDHLISILMSSVSDCDSLVIVRGFSLEFAQIYLAVLVWCGGELASPDFYSRAHIFFRELRACLNAV